MAPLLLCSSWQSVPKLFLLVAIASHCTAFSPEGCAARPLDKKRIAVLGGGGTLGAVTFGFLQRAGSIWGTGVDRNCRCLGATSATAVALNRMLSKQFILAQADDTFIKLTDFSSVDSIAQSLNGIDAVILGTELEVETRPVTGGTFEKSPNDKCLEVYWDTRRADDESTDDRRVQQILDNTLQACEKAGIQHVVSVSGASSAGSRSFLEKLKGSSIPCSLIQYSGELSSATNYNYQKGLQENLQLSLLDKDEVMEASPASTIFREDIAALSVQCLQSFNWSQSRILAISSTGPLVVENPSSKRHDQCWCVNSHVLEEKLGNL